MIPRPKLGLITILHISENLFWVFNLANEPLCSRTISDAVTFLQARKLKTAASIIKLLLVWLFHRYRRNPTRCVLAKDDDLLRILSCFAPESVTADWLDDLNNISLMQIILRDILLPVNQMMLIGENKSLTQKYFCTCGKGLPRLSRQMKDFKLNGKIC